MRSMWDASAPLVRVGIVASNLERNQNSKLKANSKAAGEGARPTLIRHAEIYATFVVCLGGRFDVEPGQWEFRGTLLAEDPERAADNCVILHFLCVLVAKDKQRRS